MTCAANRLCSNLNITNSLRDIARTQHALDDRTYWRHLATMSAKRISVEKQIERDLANRFRAFPCADAESLVLGAHLLASDGHSCSLLGQLPAREAGDDWFLTLPFGLGMDEASVDGLVRFDRTLQPADGRSMVNPGLRFHIWIYDQHQDVRAIVHTHPPYTVALAMTHMPLCTASMDAAMFHDDVAQLQVWPGAPEGHEEARLIAEALGSKSSLLLSSHGLLCTGRTIHEAVYRAVFLERAARAQLRAAASGTLRSVDDLAVHSGHHAMTRDAYVNATMAYLYRRVARKSTLQPHA